MTRDEILKTIESNKDLLTPENYQKYLANTEILTDQDRVNIANFLAIAKEMIDINKKFVESRQALYQTTETDLDAIRKALNEERNSSK